MAKTKLKNLANCKPSEFLRQTNRIRKSLAKWLTDTDIQNIRKRLPQLDENASDEERSKALADQRKENFNAILDSVLEEHPDETLEVLALASFVEPQDVDDHTIDEYLESFTELLNDETVLNFFTSLMGLASKFGS